MSNPSDRVLGTPPTNAPILPAGLIQQQRKRERALKRIAKLKEKAAAEIERLLAFLDACDPYVTAELEDQVDDNPCDDTELEPSLGAFDAMTNQDKSWRRLQGEFGAEEDAEEDDCDAEPSLGSVENHPNGYLDGSDCGRGGKTQECWASGNRDDCEGDEHDGREPENEGGEAVREDCEPSLGWTDAESATGRHTGWGGETYDLEVDL